MSENIEQSQSSNTIPEEQIRFPSPKRDSEDTKQNSLGEEVPAVVSGVFATGRMFLIEVLIFTSSAIFLALSYHSFKFFD